MVFHLVTPDMLLGFNYFFFSVYGYHIYVTCEKCPVGDQEGVHTSGKVSSERTSGIF